MTKRDLNNKAIKEECLMMKFKDNKDEVGP